MVEQWSPKPRAEGSSPSAPAKKPLRVSTERFFRRYRRTRGTGNVPGCGVERRRWRMKRDGAGAAVKRHSEQTRAAGPFGHRAPGCEARESFCPCQKSCRFFRQDFFTFWPASFAADNPTRRPYPPALPSGYLSDNPPGWAVTGWIPVR